MDLLRIAARVAAKHDCTKCYKPIPDGQEVEAFGTLYHKGCAPKGARSPKTASPSGDGVHEAMGAQPTEAVYMSVQFPKGMDRAEAVERAKELVPCEVGGWEEVDAGEDWVAGNLECEAGFYEENPDGGEYGPDDAGVSVSWETP